MTWVSGTSKRVRAFSTICPHLGCVPAHKPEVQPQPFDPNWKGGFYCPCHGSRFKPTGELISGPAEEPLEKINPPSSEK